MGLLGSGSKGRTHNPSFKGTRGTPANIDMLRPAESGDKGVVEQRKNEATKGVMQKRQLKSNKSIGLGKLTGKRKVR